MGAFSKLSECMARDSSGTFMEQTMFLSNHEHEADETLVTVVRDSNSEPFCVQSVYPYKNGSDWECAIVSPDMTSWLAPINLVDDIGETKDLLQVGDTIRLGSLDSNHGLTGYTDYVVITEIQKIKKVHNTTGETVQIGTGSDDSLIDNASTGTLSENRYMYRVNSVLNVTELPNYLPDTNIRDPNTDEYYVGTTANGVTTPSANNWWSSTKKKGITLANRLSAINNHAPVYKMNYPKTTDLKLTLDRGIGTVHRITLIGYHIKSSDSGLFDSIGGSRNQDYYTLRIKELQGGGGLISNKPTPNGCFAVLSTGHSEHRSTGAIEYEMHDPVSGIASARVNSSQPLKTLTVEVLDMNGELAKVNKLHLWFKLLTSSC